MSWDDDLLGTAREIAATNENPLRIMAGPGAGKSFAMKRRVQRLLEEGGTPEKILACTFTRTAAADLKKDLQGLGVPGAENIKASTLHSLCYAIFMRQNVLNVTGRVPRPLLKFEEKFLLKDLSGGKFGGLRSCGKHLKAFNADWARLQSDVPGWPEDPLDREFHDALISWLQFYRGMLIGELVPLARQFLRNNPESPELERYDHVLVDKYQDLNKAEQELAALLGRNTAMVIIGDEDQSIYSFKHAHPEGIVEFHKDHPTTYDMSLGVCRRCPTDIVAMANSIIDRNHFRQPRVMEPLDENPSGEVHIVQWKSMQTEIDGLTKYVRYKVESGAVTAGSVLILAPNRQFGYALRDQLNEEGIKAVSFFSEQALDGRPEDLNASKSQQAMTLLRLKAYPGDLVSLRAWCGFGSSSLNEPSWRRIRKHCRENNMTSLEVLEGLRLGTFTLAHTGGATARYEFLLGELDLLDTLTGQALVDAIFPDGEEWAIPFRDLTEGVEVDELDAEGLEKLLRGGIAHQEIPGDAEFIRVMSLYKSKGLTADLVVIVGCVEGLLPRKPDAETEAEQDRQMEESRRLFYVGITRARETLVMSSLISIPRDLAWKIGVKVVGGDAKTAFTQTSRFIGEIGPKSPEPVRGAVFLANHGLI